MRFPTQTNSSGRSTTATVGWNLKPLPVFVHDTHCTADTMFQQQCHVLMKQGI
jgi:hypothetical protein